MTPASFLRRLASWARPARRPHVTPRRPSKPRLLLEPLEERSLLSGSPPAVLVSGPSQVAEAPAEAAETSYGAYTLNLVAVDPENDPVTQWTINWGDGSVQTLPGNPSSATHRYANGPTVRNISASAVVGGETFEAHVAAPGAFLGTFAQTDPQQLDRITFARELT